MLLIVGVILALTPFAAADRADLGVQEQVLFAFAEDEKGAYPMAGVVTDAQGNLYGTTNLAGAGVGTVFELSPAQGGGWMYNVLHTFNFDDGGNSRSGLLYDLSGNLYGTSSEGGASNFGTVFELSPDGSGGWSFQTIYNFNVGDGAFPAGELISDDNGALYGMTGAGGSSNHCNFGCGTVFQLQRNSLGQWIENVLYSFQGFSDGTGPIGRLVRDRAGNFYGIVGSTQCQGGCGSVFRLHRKANGTWQKQTVYSFSDKQHGWFPNGGLTFDGAGNLYGTTQLGGELGCNPPNGCGVVFKINALGEESVVHSFSNHNGDGLYPGASLVLGPGSHLLGTTTQGGHGIPNCEFGCGTVFDVTPSGKVAIVFSFGLDNGASPMAPVFWDGKGHVYGTTFEGGSGFAGTVFELTR